MQTSKWREPIFALLFVLLAGLLIGALSLAFRPLRVDYGAVWGPYLAEPEDSLDYLYLGSSYAYCDVDPAVIYDRTGLTGYVLAGPEQTLSQTYWYLREALETQSPGLVVLEGSALAFQKYQSYTQVNVGYMHFGLNQLGAIFTASEPELRTGLLFPLYFYHNRWKELTVSEAAAALLPSDTDTLKGFTPVSGVFAQIADGPFTRAQIAAILNRAARVLGVETEGYGHSFTDVSGHWAEPELGWPVHAGILSGVGEGRFDPDGVLTTEQAILMTWRALEALG